MKLDKIVEMWGEDNTFDGTNLTEESVKSLTLHSKYYEILVHEKLRLSKLECDIKVLSQLKIDYYNGELAMDVLKDYGWSPCTKRILKSDIDRYVQADPDIIKMKLDISLQKEKVTMLQEVINTLNRRSFTIKNIIDWEKFKAGEY
jgi:hypothetical protein